MNKPQFTHATPAEARVARKLVREALARGYAVSVNDGSRWLVRRSRRMREICGALASTECDMVGLTNENGERFSVVLFFLFWGNASDGSELIANRSHRAEADEILRAVYG